MRMFTKPGVLSKKFRDRSKYSTNDNKTNKIIVPENSAVTVSKKDGFFLKLLKWVLK